MYENAAKILGLGGRRASQSSGAVKPYGNALPMPFLPFVPGGSPR